MKTYYANTRLYTISAIPEEVLFHVIPGKEMSHYFRKTLGALRKKTECISEIDKIIVFPEKSGIFFRNVENDFEATRAAGVCFVGRVKTGDENSLTGMVDVEVVIPDLRELARYIEVHQ